ncbi:unnamed protein product [Bursaphelenchus xylophilus]|uniref:(pine wood nematode) hypothetical protein n=1 Tax=Bursaphelenchus xylophilus TaxID=6326 RepID=A0A1I7RHE5_BURXY|nr:unnamed protein product [Bursaphelenchus xylophilus]CAG9115811.1 unnamed protein product [Bursaphelenchus xylophilus]
MGRKRYRTYEQRLAANWRERKRMSDIYRAFELLRDKIPVENNVRKLSRLELLRFAVTYIRQLEQQLL